MPEPHATLWVLWEPANLPDDGSPVVSFLGPAEEAALAERIGGRLIRARALSRTVKTQALRIYYELVSAIGRADVDGMTLRQRMERPDESSAWWFHSVAVKDSESDPTYRRIVEVLIIRGVARRFGSRTVALVGAEDPVARVVASFTTIRSAGTRRERPAVLETIRGVGARVKLAFTVIRDMRRARGTRGVVDPPRLDVAYSSFFDWSVTWEDATGAFRDRYLGAVDRRLHESVCATSGHLAWMDLSFEPGSSRRKTATLLRRVRDRQDLVILQGFLTIRDVLATVSDFGELKVMLRARRSGALEATLVTDGVDWRPLFLGRLLRGCLDASIPHMRLVARAARRAVDATRPRVLLSFLEHFPHSRAMYDGARRAVPGIECCAVQHASWNREKTFYYFDPVTEVAGQPDGVRVPMPDRIFVMGAIGEELFSEVGYRPGRLERTGSPRFPDVASWLAWKAERVTDARDPSTLNVLFAASIDAETEVDALEALALAASEVPEVVLRVRSHPFGPLDHEPRLAPYRSAFASSTTGSLRSGSLLEELSKADLVVVTYSTVGEEAFVRGIPVARWRPQGFDGSVLEMVPEVRCASTIEELAGILRRQLSNPGEAVSADRRRAVAELLFGPITTDPATLIAMSVGAILAAGEEAHGVRAS
jgi:surface carbohydrate biosynthesis protein (TIGR04326 family)